MTPLWAPLLTRFVTEKGQRFSADLIMSAISITDYPSIYFEDDKKNLHT